MTETPKRTPEERVELLKARVDALHRDIRIMREEATAHAARSFGFGLFCGLLLWFCNTH